MENGKSIGDVIGESLRPRTVLDELRERLREAQAEEAEKRAALDVAAAATYDLLAEIDRVQGDALGADYHRAEALLRREYTAEARQAAHVTWVRWQASKHLKAGTVPSAGGYAAREVEEEMDRQRGGSVQ